MNKRLLEKIYDAYLEELDPVEGYDEEVNKNLEKKIMEIFKQPLKEDVETTENRSIEPGDVYLMFMGDVPIHYVIYEEVDENLFEVLKVTSYWQLASNLDLITEINNELFAIECYNFFYLTSGEIMNSVYYAKISEYDYELVKTFKKGNMKALPNHRRGLTPITDDSIQAKFRKKEAELVREFSFRLLMDLPED